MRGQTIWGYINAFAGAVTALLAPFLGAIADKVGRRKPWIGAIVVMMCPAILLLWFAVPGSADVGIATVAIATAMNPGATRVRKDILLEPAISYFKYQVSRCPR